MTEPKSIGMLIREICLILLPALLAAFIVNGLSPAGIPLVGQWDVDQGVVTAHGPQVHEGRGTEVLSAQEARRIHETGAAVFVDARSEATFFQGHIPGAVSFPFPRFEEMAGEFWERYPPETEIVTYCSGRLCDDAHRLAGLLRDFGYENVRVFIDGLEGWKQAGYSLARPGADPRNGATS